MSAETPTPRPAVGIDTGKLILEMEDRAEQTGEWRECFERICQRANTLEGKLAASEARCAELAKGIEALRAALVDARVSLHARGDRPETCYAMNVLDAALRDKAEEGKL